MGCRYLLRTRGIKANPTRVLFSAYSGRQFACSPRSIYEQMLVDGNCDGFTFVWAFENPEEFGDLESPRCKVVKYGSKEFEKEAAGCGYWVSNNRLPSSLIKRKRQVYIQTWHGTPLKRLGFDVTGYIDGADDIESLRYSYLTEAKRFDYLLSPSPYYTRVMAGAFGLDRLGREDKIAELGYPRNDALCHPSREEIEAARREIGVPEGARVILYAPTWREKDLKPGEGFSYSRGIDFHPGLDFHEFLQSLPGDVIILLRTHYYVSRNIDLSRWGDRVIDVSGFRDINQLYLASDVLLTDYSSVFFDYGMLERPMVFYMYDLEDYRSVRDFYFDIDELPGEVVTEEDRISPAVKDALSRIGEPATDRMKAFREKFAPIDEPCASEVIRSLITG
ncbi:MAG: CDP-glycerol glycerophosphotransferase family protein [Eubacterium sp.]|nr:CDP-glycerol glycerophosphotransferase family protein [Eubacterium sp.]